MEIITKYFAGLSDLQLEQFGQLGSLYEEWNTKINVISRKDIEQLYERHVLHSLAIARVAKALNLANIQAEHIRVEDVKQTFDFVVSRAVTAFPRFVSMVRSKISSHNNNDLPNGIIYLKGGDFEVEINQFKQQVKVYELQNFFQEEFFETKKLIHMALKNK